MKKAALTLLVALMASTSVAQTCTWTSQSSGMDCVDCGWYTWDHSKSYWRIEFNNCTGSTREVRTTYACGTC